MRQTKARNGFSALKTRGYHVASPFVDPKAPLPGPTVGTGLRWARATGKTPGSTPERITGTGKGVFWAKKGVPRVDHMASPYFEGDDSISRLRLPQFQAFRRAVG